MNLTWPWMLALLIPVGAAALWALRHPRRRQITVPSVTLWNSAADQAGRAQTSPDARVRLSWLCLLVGAILAVLAATGPVAQLRPQRRQVTLLVAGGELDSVDFENAAAALLGRLSPRDRVQLLYPSSLPEGNAPTGWFSPADAQQAIRATPLTPTPASRCRFRATQTDPSMTFLFAPAGSVDPAPMGARVLACRSSMPSIVCRHATTYVQDGRSGMNVFVVASDAADVEDDSNRIDLLTQTVPGISQLFGFG